MSIFGWKINSQPSSRLTVHFYTEHNKNVEIYIIYKDIGGMDWEISVLNRETKWSKDRRHAATPHYTLSYTEIKMPDLSRNFFMKV